MQTTPTRSTSLASNRRLLVAGAVVVLGILLGLGLLIPRGTGLPSAQPPSNAGGQLLVLALPTFLAGVVSFLSPCTLPILPAYFAFTFAARRQQVAVMTLAFFLGLATTMSILGASFSLLGSLAHGYRDRVASYGGLMIVGFGILNIFGKGFSGLKLAERPATTFVGTYLYGMTFALGWTACIGPILGSLLTMLVAQGGTVIAGAGLAFIYTLGLAVPLFIVATFFGKIGTGTRFWQLLKGRGWEINLFGRTLYVHSTSLISGLLLITIGVLLASGNVGRLSTWATSGTDLGGKLQEWIANIFGVGA